MRASPPPVPEDAKRRAVNRAHAEAQKKKDAEEAKRKRKNLEREELEKRRRHQRHEGLPVEPSLSPSLSDSSSDDDESEAGRGILDHLPDIRGWRSGHRRVAQRFQGEEERIPRGRRSLAPGPRPTRPRYGR